MVHIEFSGAPSERSSPFCKQNEEICSAWEDYILSKNGKVVGKYNAFSLIIKGKMPDGWEVEIKKSTMPGGSLLLSTEFQNLFFHIRLRKKKAMDEDGYFLFRRKKMFDHWRRVFLRKRITQSLLITMSQNARISMENCMLH
ncbi:MAG: hypothetical protein ACI8XB_000766 [Patiriisocius sp.]|jgi:hypothetical protein